MNQLEQVLVRFRGMTPDQIAEEVKKHEIKGRMGTTYGCPMALLLKHEHSGIFVIGRKYIVRRSGDVIEQARTPKNLATFIHKFDVGDYPELIAPPPRCLLPAAVGVRGGRGRGSMPRKPIANHISKLVERFGEMTPEKRGPAGAGQ